MKTYVLTAESYWRLRYLLERINKTDEEVTEMAKANATSPDDYIYYKAGMLGGQIRYAVAEVAFVLAQADAKEEGAA